MQLRMLAVEAITLGTARGRVWAWVVLSSAIFAVPYQWLAHLSLWQRLGWDGAPSIGLTRAYWLLIHGDPAAAWQRNWLIFPVVVIGLSVLIYDQVHARHHRQIAHKALH